MHPRFTLPLIFVVVVELCNFSDNLISLNLKTSRRRIYKVNPPKKGFNKNPNYKVKKSGCTESRN
jgi:hypothetical protein